MTGNLQRKTELDVIEFCQHPDYPTGCESVALYMLLEYYGVEVTPDQIIDLLPKGPQPYQDASGVWHGGNPEREFVGDPRSSHSFGVFNAPIAQVAEHFLPGVRTVKGATVDDLLTILDAGSPILAWYLIDPARSVVYRCHWLDEKGETVRWPGGEHAVVLCGHDDIHLFYRDPNTGKTGTVFIADFADGFVQLGGRIVYYPFGRR
ncbi:MAG: C39 family peptidase [Erysipelotrichaceae bacterium]|nr:C39 family peptidase [Erysipelotrichaceae bacterium]